MTKWTDIFEGTNLVAQTPDPRLFFPLGFFHMNRNHQISFAILNNFFGNDVKDPFTICATQLLTISIAIWQLNEGGIIYYMLSRNIFIWNLDFSMQYFKFCFGKHGCFTQLIIMSAANIKQDVYWGTFSSAASNIHETNISYINEPTMAANNDSLDSKINWSSLLCYLFSHAFLSYLILLWNNLYLTGTIVSILFYIDEYNIL